MNKDKWINTPYFSDYMSGYRDAGCYKSEPSPTHPEHLGIVLDCSCCYLLLNMKLDKDPEFLDELKRISALTNCGDVLMDTLSKDTEFISAFTKQLQEKYGVENIKRDSQEYSGCCMPGCLDKEYLRSFIEEREKSEK